MTDNPIALCPLTTRVEAVYLDDAGNLFRSPILALALCTNSDGSGNHICFIDGEADGGISDPTSQENFIGLEFDRNILQWDEQIEALKRRRQAKPPRQP